jgi:hypothetical protein
MPLQDKLTIEKKPLKTAAALRAGDTKHLRKPSPVQGAALRAAAEIINSTVNPAMRHEAVNCNSRNLASIIASEFALLDEVVEQLRDILVITDSEQLNPSISLNICLKQSRALLERVEKGMK